MTPARVTAHPDFGSQTYDVLDISFEAIAEVDFVYIQRGTEALTVGSLRRFVLTQDTGGAIRWAHRADFLWGRGDDDAMRAGVIKQPGKLYVLMAKTATPAPAQPSER